MRYRKKSSYSRRRKVKRSSRRTRGASKGSIRIGYRM